jgi:hypothetical protein
VLRLLAEELGIPNGMLRRRVLLELKRLWSQQPVSHLQWQWCALVCVACVLALNSGTIVHQHHVMTPILINT